MGTLVEIDVQTLHCSIHDPMKMSVLRTQTSLKGSETLLCLPPHNSEMKPCVIWTLRQVFHMTHFDA